MLYSLSPPTLRLTLLTPGTLSDMTKSKNNNKHKKRKSTSRAKQFAGDPIDLGPPPDAMKPPEASPIVGEAKGLSEQQIQNHARAEDKELATNETSKISTGRWALPVMRAFNPFVFVVILLSILTTFQPVSTPTYPWPALDPVPTGTSSTSRSFLIGSSHCVLQLPPFPTTTSNRFPSTSSSSRPVLSFIPGRFPLQTSSLVLGTPASPLRQHRTSSVIRPSDLRHPASKPLSSTQGMPVPPGSRYALGRYRLLPPPESTDATVLSSIKLQGRCTDQS